MKKIITAMLIATMSLSFVACGNKSTDNNTSGSNETTTEANETTTEADETTTEADETTTAEAVTGTIENATDMLLAGYDAFAEALAPSFEMSAEDVKASFMGGYYNEDDETTLTAGPGMVPVTDATVTSIGLLPEDSVAMIDDASLVMHPMMTNYFAAMAFHVTDEANVATVAETLANAIKDNQWMCGQPEGYVVITVDSYVVSMYGLTDNIDALKDGITGACENAVIAYEGSFAE